MQFESLADLFFMGGHGVFVWAVYGVAFLILAVMVSVPVRRSRHFFTQQSMLIRREQSLKQSTEKSS